MEARAQAVEVVRRTVDFPYWRVLVDGEPVFWGTWAECRGEQRRLRAAGEAGACGCGEGRAAVIGHGGEDTR